MKIVKNKGDVNQLVFGEEYIIDYGINYNEPETIDYNKIIELQRLIELKFDTEGLTTNVAGKLSVDYQNLVNYYNSGMTVQQIATKFTEEQLITIGNSLGLTMSSKGSKLDKITQILNNYNETTR
jgi:hypothetical protein